MEQSHTIINVSRTQGRTLFGGGPAYFHFFNVRLDGFFPGNKRVKEVLKSLKERYPAPEYKITTSYAEVRYETVEPETA